MALAVSFLEPELHQAGQEQDHARPIWRALLDLAKL